MKTKLACLSKNSIMNQQLFRLIQNFNICLHFLPQPHYYEKNQREEENTLGLFWVMSLKRHDREVDSCPMPPTPYTLAPHSQPQAPCSSSGRLLPGIEQE